MLAAVERERRCPWPASDPAMIAYYDDEWGRPVHDDLVLYECLERSGSSTTTSPTAPRAGR
jgi:DNA-3-methyladenine glycosylase I